jgi:hypothetical protein
MSRRTRRVVAVIALCVAAGAALGVGGYDAASSERGVDVDVADDEHAYLGINDSVSCSGDVTLLTNRFPEPITGGTVTATVHGGNLTVGGHRYTDDEQLTIGVGTNDDEDLGVGEVDPGGSLTVTVKSGTATEITIDVRVYGDGFDVSIDGRHVDVC